MRTVVWGLLPCFLASFFDVVLGRPPSSLARGRRLPVIKEFEQLDLREDSVSKTSGSPKSSHSRTRKEKHPGPDKHSVEVHSSHSNAPVPRRVQVSRGLMLIEQYILLYNEEAEHERRLRASHKHPSLASPAEHLERMHWKQKAMTNQARVEKLLPWLRREAEIVASSNPAPLHSVGIVERRWREIKEQLA